MSEETKSAFQFGSMLLVCVAAALGLMAVVTYWQMSEVRRLYVPPAEQSIIWMQPWIVPAVLAISCVTVLLVSRVIWRATTGEQTVDTLAREVASKPQSFTPTSTTTAPAAPQGGYDIDPYIMESIKQQLAQGRKIEAIKLYREATGVGLRVAHDAIRLIDAEMRSL